MCYYCLFPLWDVLNPRRLVHLNKMLGFKHRIVVCNSLNPYIDIQILICCPYTWSIEAVGRIWWSINSIHLPWSCTQFWLPLCFTSPMALSFETRMHGYENAQRRSRLSAILWALHRGALEMPGAPQKSKVREKLATIVESQRKPNDMPCSHSFPPGPSRVLWMTAKGIWKK